MMSSFAVPGQQQVSVMASVVEIAADTFMQAWARRKWITSKAAYPDAPTSVEEMYSIFLAMQLHPVARSFGGLGGYKLGAIGMAGEPMIYAPLFRQFLVDAFLGSIAAFSSSSVQLHTIEAELGLILGSDLPARADGAAYTEQDVWTAVDVVVPCIECCGRRSDAEVTAEMPVLGKLADCLMAGGVVLGRPVQARHLDLSALTTCSTTLSVNTEQVAQGSGAECPEGSPLAATAWMANHLNQRGLWLRKGQLVITGATCKSTAFQVSDRVTATFSALGCVEMFVEP